MNIGLHVATAREAKPVAIFSLEMSKESLLTRLICSLARVDQQKFRLGYLDQDDIARLRQAAMTLYDAPLFIDDNSATTMLEMNAKLRKVEAAAWAGAGDCGLPAVDADAEPGA